MNIIMRPRNAGKTTELIKLSAQNGGYIVCNSHNEAWQIHELSRQMGLEIPFPLTYSEFLHGYYHPQGVKNLLIDNADYLINSLSKSPIEAITLTTDTREG